MVIDDAEYLEVGPTFETINQLSTGPWRFSTVLGSRIGVGLGSRITLQPFARPEIERLALVAFNGELPADQVERLLRASRGVPALARLLIEQLQAGGSLDDAERLLKPWRSSGLLGPDGRPLDGRSTNGRRLFTDIRLINNELIDHFSQFPDDVYGLTGRQFEELAAELLSRMGYDVQLTSETRDGGKDLYAAKKDGLGSFLFLVECKRFAPDRSVGVGIVRSVYGVAQHERANGAVVLTTSFFSAPAQQFARELRGQMSLKDFVGLQEWLREARQASLAP